MAHVVHTNTHQHRKNYESKAANAKYREAEKTQQETKNTEAKGGVADGENGVQGVQHGGSFGLDNTSHGKIRVFPN